MSVLIVENLSHGFADRVLFRDVSFRLQPAERVGLVGANGTGKSTLMSILTRQLIPDGGRIEWMPKVEYGYLDQHTKLEAGKTIRDVLKDAFLPLLQLEQENLEIAEKMADASPEELDQLLERMGEIQDRLDANGFYLIDAKVEEIGNALGLSAIGLDRDVASLSGGQRTKVLLAKLLLQKPSVLLLDEPTNYLDEEHISWLKNYLKEYPYAFILISHDTSFMNEVVNVIYHLEFTKLTRYTGNYESFLAQSETRRSQHFDAYEKQQEEISKMEDFIARNKARASTSGRAKSRQKQLDKIDRIDKPEVAPKPTFIFKEARASSRFVFEAEDLEIGYGKPLMPKLTMSLERGDKVAIVGMNGVGKSTLLKTILGLIPPLGGKLERGDFLYPAYFEQEVKPKNITALDEVWNEFPHLNNHEVRGALARCGLKNEHINRSMTALSGGEQAKVRLCKLLQRETNWILFDEPTNHLDVVAKEELKRSLKEFKGTILLVCHEPEFYEDWVTKVWNVEEWSQKQPKSTIRA
ncbi:ribosomal protection-like ABC-F family protein [Brevibacillus fulvus]|uniref:ATPase subunit of ABC transporter with duplicated ATPase domains n=1 Tax=Brevibacillus fulvus TaxID=1125967 RepID=A0A938Y123_9BACL|nr:ABC-F family ATP-binding cassette domain-containing protein [Brevibacillus fulvus]MBM7590489.1 ATPase subunit of ABC transporter with duplicated ATPase domains [Brevibacillus fulvus]